VRRLLAYAAAGLLTGAWLAGASASELKSSARAAVPAKPTPAKVCTTETCGGDYGTTVHFVSTPSEAARQAVKEQKLVLVLHVSGLFENPDFT
jgi:hypothetical protein